MTDGEAVFASRGPLGDDLEPLQASSLDAVRDAVSAARSAHVAWGELEPRERAARVKKAKKRLLARAKTLADMLRKECGKPIEEALLSEILPSADLFDHWPDTIEELLDASEVELDALAYPSKTGRVERAPRGVVALITPWNYPVAIPLRTLVPALCAGNAVVWKPSEVAPRSGALVAALFDGLLPPGVLQIVQGGAAVGSALVDAHLDLVVFTGSVATGKRVAVACAEALVPTSLELGGKDAAIVLEDARLERAARGIVWGAFTNAGQNCASVERVYVVKSIADAFIEKVVALTRALDPQRDLGVLTTLAQAAIVARHVNEAVASGAELLVGGEAPASDPRAFPATVLKVTDEKTPLLVDETFGPVLPIVVVDDADAAVARTNASRFGLTTSVWTRDIDRGRALAKRLRSGVVTINNHGFTAALPAAPWVGAGDSGTGVTNSPHALFELTRARFILEDRNRQKSELWWYPYGDSLRNVALAMIDVRGGSGFFGRIKGVFALLLALPKRLMGK